MYAVVHIPVDNVHTEELNVPPTFSSSQVIVPVGVVGELDVSVTVAVNVSVFPTTYDEGFGDTVTDVGESRFFTKPDVPELV